MPVPPPPDIRYHSDSDTWHLARGFTFCILHPHHPFPCIIDDCLRIRNKKLFIFNILASRVALGFASVSVATPTPFPSPFPPLSLTSRLAATPLVLYVGAQVVGGIGLGGVQLPPANVLAFLQCRWVAVSFQRFSVVVFRADWFYAVLRRGGSVWGGEWLRLRRFAL